MQKLPYHVLPTAELPTTVAATNQTRKERQDSRTITVLLQEKVKTFEHVKKGTDEPLKKKRKTFVPPFGAAITEQIFRDMIKERELEKQKTKPPKTHTIDLNTEHIGIKNLKIVEDHPMNIHVQFGFNHICSF